MARTTPGDASCCWGTLLGAGDAPPGTLATRPSGSLTVTAAGPSGGMEQPLDHMDDSKRQLGGGDAKHIAGMPPPPPALGVHRGAASTMPCLLTPCCCSPNPQAICQGIPMPHGGTRSVPPGAAGWRTRRPLRGCPIPSTEGTAGPRVATLSLPWLLSRYLCPPRCRDVSPSWGLPPNPPCPKQQLPYNELQAARNKLGTKHLQDSQEPHVGWLLFAFFRGDPKQAAGAPGMAQGSLQLAGPHRRRQSSAPAFRGIFAVKQQ